MIIPSIDLMGGQAVQLIGGEKKAIEAGDPLPIAERFSVAGEIAVIDLDAALGQGSNEPLIREIIARYPCRVGGGIRDEAAAVKWLDAGARQIILGTAATPELLSRLPRERVIAALDARHGEVVVEGWKKGTGRTILDGIEALKPYVGGFLITFVEREGRMGGVGDEELRRVQQVVAAADGVRVTVAGGVREASDVGAIDRAGADVQVGMALYSGKMALAEAIAAPLRSDRPDGLWPTVIVDQHERALGLVYSDQQSLSEAVTRRLGAYHSRSRGLWVKGETSGNTQELIRIDLDCDRDALRFVVRQQGAGFCHEDTWTCWGDDRGLPRLLRLLEARRADAPEGSYTKRLYDDPALLRAKLIEEAGELADAPPDEVALEAADLIYFALVAMARSGIDLAQVEQVLDGRNLKLIRRPGDAKE
jgi:phosphoribosyl-ATP pyrophosphohydrolase